mmetsp:Transcript_30001/g.95999  ORF Transcript_30001/g.95999 Transcript_30001/m.95999 type:complete len:356 (+) Transcript_30001:774-1841(+)
MAVAPPLSPNSATTPNRPAVEWTRAATITTPTAWTSGSDQAGGGPGLKAASDARPGSGSRQTFPNRSGSSVSSAATDELNRGGGVCRNHGGACAAASPPLHSSASLPVHGSAAAASSAANGPCDVPRSPCGSPGQESHERLSHPCHACRAACRAACCAPAAAPAQLLYECRVCTSRRTTLTSTTAAARSPSATPNGSGFRLLRGLPPRPIATRAGGGDAGGVTSKRSASASAASAAIAATSSSSSQPAIGGPSCSVGGPRRCSGGDASGDARKSDGEEETERASWSAEVEEEAEGVPAEWEGGASAHGASTSRQWSPATAIEKSPARPWSLADRAERRTSEGRTSEGRPILHLAE